MANPSSANADIEHILIVDDELLFHRNMRESFPHLAFQGAVSAEKMREKLNGQDKYSLILLDLVLEENSTAEAGLRLIPEIQQAQPGVPIIVVTHQNDLPVVVKAMSLGAKNFLHKKSFDPEAWGKQFAELLEQRRLRNENQELKQQTVELTQRVQRLEQEDEDEKYRFIGSDHKVLDVKAILEALANEPEVTVLITGETGTGKEVAARYLHRNSPRSQQPFVAVDLSILSKDLMEGQLFGARKGAYTGAEEITGYFQQAHKGVLLLDEIGEINAELQVKLLRFLEQKVIRPLGASQDIQLDLQIVTATNRNLAEEVRKGNFRQDLYQRLKNFVVELPPLRQRTGDLLLILEHYLRLKMPNVALTEFVQPEVLDHLLRYDWPGNVRELRSTLDAMLVRRKVHRLEHINASCLPDEIRHFNPASVSSSKSPEAPPTPARKEQKALDDLLKIEAALRATNSNKTVTAQQLGYPGTDNLLSRVRICYQNYPHLFDNLPLVKDAWPTVIKQR